MWDAPSEAGILKLFNLISDYILRLHLMWYIIFPNQRVQNVLKTCEVYFVQ